jgi:hypothetical protein
MRRLLSLSICAACALTLFAAGNAVAAPATLTGGPTDGSMTNQYPAFTWTHSDAAINTWFCTLNGKSVPCNDGVGYVLGDGTYAFTLSGTGQTEGPTVCYDDPMMGPWCYSPIIDHPAEPVSVTFTVDRTAPALNVDSGPSDGGSISGTSTSFAFTSENGLTIDCSPDGTTAVDCTNGISLSELTPGIHTLRATVTDAAGNVTTSLRTYVVTGIAIPTATTTPATPTAPATPATPARKRYKLCYRTPIIRRGKIVRKKSGRARYRTLCRTVKLTG